MQIVNTGSYYNLNECKTAVHNIVRSNIVSFLFGFTINQISKDMNEYQIAAVYNFAQVFVF